MLDKEGFRLNVGIILHNGRGRLFWGKRMGYEHWQFPQGGIHHGETAEQALYRELYEEIGLCSEDVALVTSTRKWLRYRLPKHLVRSYRKPVCVGQKQKWFLLRLKSSEQKIRLDLNPSPEFDSWQWIDYWIPSKNIIDFKQHVYQHALQEFEPFVLRGIHAPTSTIPSG